MLYCLSEGLVRSCLRCNKPSAGYQRYQEIMSHVTSKVSQVVVAGERCIGDIMSHLEVRHIAVVTNLFACSGYLAWRHVISVNGI